MAGMVGLIAEGLLSSTKSYAISKHYAMLASHKSRLS
jgi:hypothetical protein